MSAPPRLLPLGDAAWTVEFGRDIAPAAHARVLGLARALEALDAAGQCPEGLIEWAPSFRSLSVYFDPARLDGKALGQQLLELARNSQQHTAKGRHWRLPVCFEGEFAPDLAAVARACSLTEPDVVGLMAETVFTVYMIGFLPGFPYLGGLPEALDMPRLTTPRTRVPARSVAIAGRMAAAYPWESPGGWHLLGRTPIPLFDAQREQGPALLAPGDTLQWEAIDRDRYQSLEQAMLAGELTLEELG